MKRMAIALGIIFGCFATAKAEAGNFAVTGDGHAYTVHYQIFQGYGIVSTDTNLADSTVLLQEVQAFLQERANVAAVLPSVLGKPRVCIIQAFQSESGLFQFSYRTFTGSDGCPTISLGH